MSGISGSGKSTYGKKLLAESSASVKKVVSADLYFFDEDGVYRWDPKKLKDAHRWCYQQFLDFLCDNDGSTNAHVVVDNTNTSRWEMERYAEGALRHGFALEVITILYDPENGAEDNVHNVPLEATRRMNRKLQDRLREGIPAEWNERILRREGDEYHRV